MLWLLLFLAVAVVIQARQSAAIRSATELRQLREQRTGLEAERAALQHQIRLATSRQVLGRLAESELGLHLPTDSEFILLPRSSGPSR
jgi:hypothetical protein